MKIACSILFVLELLGQLAIDGFDQLPDLVDAFRHSVWWLLFLIPTT